MSAEARKNCRLQGKYNDRNEDKRTRKSLEKRLKESPTEKETQERKFLKRKSDGTKEATSFSNENSESLEYQENSDHSFAQLEERKKPIEIKKSGKFVLSNTENGESSVLYEPNFYTEDEGWELFDILYNSTEWLDKSIVIHGIEYPQPRLVAWYGPLPYSYSGTTLEAAEMPDCVLSIKRRVEDYLKGQNINVELNSVLLNLYRNNKDSVSWHSDDELTMGICPTIASISLGEIRKFEMRPKSNKYYDDEQEKKPDEYFVHLNNGSLIVMDGCMQEDWQHRVPKEYHDRNPRINLTFRTVYEFEKGSPYSVSRVNNYKPVGQEISKNSNRAKIDLDEENFPPLSSVSNNGNSKTAHISNVKIEPFAKINDQINSSEEEWIVKTPLSNKTTSSRIFDEINASEEEWVVKTPPVETVLNASTKTNGTGESKHSTVESISKERNHPEAIYKVKNPENTPEREWEVSSAVRVNLNSEFSEISKSNYNFSEESAYIRPPTPLESNDKPCRDWYDESYNIEILSEPNKTNQLPEVRHEKSFDYQDQISSEPDKTYQSNDNCFQESHYRQTPLVTNKSHQHNEDYFERAHQRRTPFESNKPYRSNEDKFERASHRRIPLESNKPCRSTEDKFERASHRRIPLESNKPFRSKEHNFEGAHQRQNSLQSNKLYRSNEDNFERDSQRQNPLQSNKPYRNEDYFERDSQRRIPLESNKPYRPNRSNFERAHHRKTPLESIKKHQSNEDYFERAHQRQTPLESNKSYEDKNAKPCARSNWFHSDRTNKYPEESSAKTINKTNGLLETNKYNRHNERGHTEPYNKNTSSQERNFNSDELESFESHNTEKKTISNNEKKSIETEFLNENADGIEQKSNKTQNSNAKERKNESSNFAVLSMRRQFSDIRNEALSRNKGLNVKAQEFVPGKMKKLPLEREMCPLRVDTSTFGHFNLADLLNYDVDLMPSDELKNYADALKLRVSKGISAFETSDKEELEILCEITDGTQTDKNQKIICSRICALVSKTMPKKQLNCNINLPMPRYQQQANYRNENHYLDRRCH